MNKDFKQTSCLQEMMSQQIKITISSLGPFWAFFYNSRDNALYLFPHLLCLTDIFVIILHIICTINPKNVQRNNIMSCKFRLFYCPIIDIKLFYGFVTKNWSVEK